MDDKEETLREQITGRVFIYSYFKQNQNSEEVLNIWKARENHWICSGASRVSFNMLLPGFR